MEHLPADTRRSILLLSFATFSSMAAQRLCDAMLPELAREFSISLAQAAQTISFFAITYGLSQLFYGPLGDRLGKFRVVALATLGSSLGSLLAVFADSLSMLVVARVLAALGAAAIIPLSMAWIGDQVAYEQRMETLARVGLGSTLGLAAGQSLGGLFTDTLGWRWAFVFMTLLSGAVGTLLWRNWRQQQRQPQVAHETQDAVRPSFLQQTFTIYTGRWSRLILLLAFLEGGVGFGAMAIWPSHLHHVLGLSLAASGAIVALFGLGGMLYMALARWLIPRFGERGLALLGVSILLLSVGVFVLSPHWLPTLPASLLAGFGFFMFHNTMQGNATQMAPAARGAAMSLFAFTLFTGQSIGVIAAAALAQRFGSGTIILLSAAVMFALGAALSLALRRRDAWMQLA